MPAAKKPRPRKAPVKQVEKKTVTTTTITFKDTEGDNFVAVVGPAEAKNYYGEANPVKEGNVRITAPCGEQSGEFKVSTLEELLTVLKG